MRETALFREDMEALRILPPAHYVGAVESIPAIADEVVDAARRRHRLPARRRHRRRLLRRRRSAATSATSRTSTRQEMLAFFAERGGDPDRAGKRDALDPLLWRGARDGEPAWAGGILGPGRPGWHIECAVIALGLLGAAHRRPGRRQRPAVPAPRDVGRARRGADRRGAVRPALRARRHDRAGRREDEQEPRQPGVRVPAARRPRRLRWPYAWPCWPTTTATIGSGRTICSRRRSSGCPAGARRSRLPAGPSGAETAGRRPRTARRRSRHRRRAGRRRRLGRRDARRRPYRRRTRRRWWRRPWTPCSASRSSRPRDPPADGRAGTRGDRGLTRGHRSRVGPHRRDRLRWPAGAHRAAARPVRTPPGLAAGIGVRRRRRGDEPAARAGIHPARDLLRLAAAGLAWRDHRRRLLHRARPDRDHRLVRAVPGRAPAAVGGRGRGGRRRGRAGGRDPRRHRPVASELAAGRLARPHACVGWSMRPPAARPAHWSGRGWCSCWSAAGSPRRSCVRPRTAAG